MVLEHLFPPDWMEKKMKYALILGFVYSLISILLARYIFGSNSGIASVIFLSILLVPSMKKLFRKEERIEEKEKRFTLKHLYKDNEHLITAYVGLFMGIFLAYMSSIIMLGLGGGNMLSVFKEQLFLDPAISGRNVPGRFVWSLFNMNTFLSILSNNWIVLLVTFLLAVLAGDGALFFVAWNASAWGTIFGYRAVMASFYSHGNILYYVFVLLGLVVWHVLLEGGAYILAAISGSIISDDVIKKSDELQKFVLLGLLIFSGIFVMSNLFRSVVMASSGAYALMIKFILTFIPLIISVSLVYTLKNSFTNKKHVEVFVYNYWLFVFAILVFIIGAFVETLVLSNSSTLHTIYQQSALQSTLATMAH